MNNLSRMLPNNEFDYPDSKQANKFRQRCMFRMFYFLGFSTSSPKKGSRSLISVSGRSQVWWLVFPYYFLPFVVAARIQRSLGWEILTMMEVLVGLRVARFGRSS